MAELIMQEEGSTPATPSTGKWKAYFKSDGLYVIDDLGTETGPFTVGGGGGGDVIRTKYIITPSVASNNLTLAIKYIDGTDPSATKKLTFRVGNTEYDLTAAMSFTKNAATNWCNAGSAELAAKDVDYFVYAIGETGASAGLKFGFSRIPYALTMGDFVNTTTNEKYIAGNWTNFNATDAVTVIGRFRAQLSAGAGYTWSIPAAKVVNYPIFETDWLTWTPAITCSGSFTYTSVTTTWAIYRIVGTKLEFSIRQTGTAGGTASNTIFNTLPFACSKTGTYPGGWGQCAGGLSAVIGLQCGSTPNTISVQKYDISNFTNSGTLVVAYGGLYPLN
jgi:hypothetical protein